MNLDDNISLAQKKKLELKKLEIEEAKKNYITVLIYGSDQLGFTSFPTHIIENKNYKIYFYPLSNSASPPFTDFNIVVINFGVFFKSNSAHYDFYESELAKRKKEMVEFLKKKGSTACFLIKDAQMGTVVGSSYINFKERDLVIDFMQRNGISPTKLQERVDTFHINRGEFKPFLEKYGIASSKITFSGDDFTILCSEVQGVYGIAKGSKIICLPYHLVVNNVYTLDEFYTTLVDCILAYNAKIYYEVPNWLSDFTFKTELPLIEKKKSIEEKLNKLELQLKDYEEYKRILFLGDDVLKDEVRNLLNKGLGFLVEDNEIYIEDLWVNDGKNNPIAIIEVKGLNENVKYGDISQLVTHRERQNLQFDFPAILIANTMMKATTSIKDKEVDIHPDIVKHAINNNVLIIRTLDLLKVSDLILSKTKKATEFLDLIKTKTGWLLVENGEITIKSD